VVARLSWDQCTYFITTTLRPLPPPSSFIRAREEAIAIEMMKQLQEKIRNCQRANPVTHYYKCAELAETYLKFAKVSSRRRRRTRRVVLVVVVVVV